MPHTSAEEKLKLLSKWVKTVKELLEADDRVEIKVQEVDHEIDISIKVNHNRQ